MTLAEAKAYLEAVDPQDPLTKILLAIIAELEKTNG